jgi:hypothetical protein
MTKLPIQEGWKFGSRIIRDMSIPGYYRLRVMYDLGGACQVFDVAQVEEDKEQIWHYLNKRVQYIHKRWACWKLKE